MKYINQEGKCMRKLERRAIMCLMLAAVLFLGIVVFAWRYVVNGKEWAGFYGNTQVFTNGIINRGTVYDRNGVMLINCTEDGIEYPEDSVLREATLHVVGDPEGNISSGAINMFAGDLVGYDILNGTYDETSEGKSIELTIDALANETAYNSLSNYSAGCLGIFNYETGEIMCLVSTPSIDPQYQSTTEVEDSVYFNNFIQGQVTPGSTFKLVTTAAAIDTLDMSDFSFTCDGVNEFNGDDLTCIAVHGEEDFYGALANSCNGAFGQIAREVGGDTLTEYVDKLGLTTSVDIDGITTAQGSFYFPTDDELELSWAGVGQGQDLVNPCTMMVYMGAIANGGVAMNPTIIKSSNFLDQFTQGKTLGRYLDEDTADEIKAMMKNNVEVSYGASNFEGLDMYAKTGTAEVGDDNKNSLFAGFIVDDEHPYAFYCWVEGGLGGVRTCSPIVRDTLNVLIANN